MAYRASYKSEMDQAVLGWIPSEGAGISIKEIAASGFKMGTVRNSVARLEAAKLIQGRWDGNARYGRYLYTRPTNF